MTLCLRAPDAGPLSWIGLLGTVIIATLAASLLRLAVSRQRKYLADATGAELLGRAAPLAMNPATASLYTVNPLTRQGCGDPLHDAPAARRGRTQAARARRRSGHVPRRVGRRGQ